MKTEIAAAQDNAVRREKRKASVRRGLFIASFIGIPILHFLVFFVYTNADTILLSFQTFDNMTGGDKWGGVRNYSEFFHQFVTPNTVLPKAIRNSIYFFLLNDFVILPLSFFAAFFLYKKMPLGNVFRVLFFIPSIISVVVLTMLFSFMFDSSIGVVDSLLRAIGLERVIPDLGWFGDKRTAMPLLLLYCVWAGIGYNVVLLSGAMSRVPSEIVESGRLDGLTMFREMRSITLPLTGSTISTLLMMGVTVIFTLFMQPQLITNGGPNGETYTIALYIVNAIRSDGNLTMGATVGILCALVGTPIVLVVRKVLEKVFPVYEY